MTTATRTPPPHGTLSRRKYHRCACELCIENYREYERLRHRKQGYGTWQPYIDAEPVRQHLLTLHDAGLSYAVIADRIGHQKATITRFIYPLGPKRHHKKRVTPELAAKILAVTAEDLTPGMLDATGTGRRIHALAALGWPMIGLGPHIGIAPQSVRRLGVQKQVFPATARAVAECYEDLRHKRPEDNGIADWVALKTRNLAARHNWHDPQWWDDMGHIDDPNFDPDAAEKPLGRNELAAHRRAEVEHLVGYGLTENDIGPRLGLAAGTVKDIITELRRGQRRDRKQAAA